jgi:4-hydroxy-tetrahydrodipicolinate reductase
LHQLTDEQKTKMTELVNHLKGTMKPLKIALFGTGKMGSLVAEVAHEKGYSIQSLEDADLAIDFSHPSAVLNNIAIASEAGKNVVIGTTGWEKDLQEVKTLISEKNIGALYSPNFSIGVHLYLKALQTAAELIALQGGYDVGGYEIHHNQKADSPSGTAKTICSTLLKNFKNKKEALFETSHAAVSSDQLHFSSLRLGHSPGIHTVTFDSPFDSITLTHSAKNRKGFATGAVIAAEWLHGKKGFYTLEDIL